VVTSDNTVSFSLNVINLSLSHRIVSMTVACSSYEETVLFLPWTHWYDASKYEVRSCGQGRIPCSEKSATVIVHRALPEQRESANDITSTAQPIAP